ncbi:MAG: hypothetical protein M1834_001598 [Cirrosporium novae-zelandiae]|nr:MAG: hypothetical protein M1834_004115 [Cirrosporium novae-zelandiae]KAI9735582.1 MAG: hypothetical protein M1834_001598 [Cirrosporium novae-zelandiae]
MALLNRFFAFLYLALFCLPHLGSTNPLPIKPYKRELLQDIVTWDEHSLFVRGERIMVFSAEFHPFRLPVVSLWLDIFQKIKALGYSAVSFYVDWALHEDKPGDFTAEGVFAWEPFFNAASEAGIYLIARPGPYINAEVSGGGFPGWLQTINGTLRTREGSYMESTDNYVAEIGAIVAKAQITNGGPVILLQPENEYSEVEDGYSLDNEYMQAVEDQYRAAGIVVPFMNNDAAANGYNAPGTGVGEVDIYGHDSYPMDFDCANPTTWASGGLPTTFLTKHLAQSPSTPYTVPEFQGGAFDPWGGNGFDKCSILLNNEFERVFYKNQYSFGNTIFSVYMTYGGTNWGNLGHPGGYTSYDYGAAIAEDRTITREKYSEAKLEANMLKVSPAFLTATPKSYSTAYTDNSAITVSPLIGNGTDTNFYVVRHTAYNSLASTSYSITVDTTKGSVTIPQLDGTLTLNGRDSKIYVTDYNIGDYTLLYSSAEVFTWKNSTSKTVLVLYGVSSETNEAAFTGVTNLTTLEGAAPTQSTKNGSLIINWTASSTRTVVKVGSNLYVYLLDRNSAYDYWALDIPSSGVSGNYTVSTANLNSVVAKAGYLLRTVSVSGSTLALTGDVNATTPLEVIFGAPSNTSTVTFNGESISFSQDKYGVVTASIDFTTPSLDLPTLSELSWKYIDSLPEIQSSYDDPLWTDANKTSTNNPTTLKTPTVLYAAEYGYYSGQILYRGHFTATGNESTFELSTQGGSAYGHSVWLNSTFLGSWTGIDVDSNYNQTFTLPNLVSGKPYTITVVVDTMGQEENWYVGPDEMKFPRGILDYTLSSRSKSAITWKLAGTLGGQDYLDKTRGPLNEGGIYAERNGYHLPSPPSSTWETSSPLDGIAKAGVAFYTTSFTLDMPSGYDIPLAFVYTNTTANGTVSDFRSQFYVNGWQFGKYVNNVGPQTSYPVPEGILDYHGTNYLAVMLWAQGDGGAKLGGFTLEELTAVKSGLGTVEITESPEWEEREGAY